MNRNLVISKTGHGMVTRSVVERMSLDELLKLEQALLQPRPGVQMAEALAAEAITYSQRLASVNHREGAWKHALIERFPVNTDCPSRKEIWIIFRSSDIELAKTFHSYPYWKHALQRGDTVLCSGRMMSWNVLCSTDVIHKEVRSSKLRISEWDMKTIVTEGLKKFGV